ncbi:MAG: LuxR C-terminal-related transcriptional regulator [Tenuifilaceae bacterium]|jgi:DNA-binding CsgD family transcriptional regulator|nr:LuxR C-terminal-related transcriptional regulator [Bacteroidales bacterium]MDI9516208.1 LuxR C-terminal-related transcriptional regulator [Bacteroidota bacterium]OQC64909.1 MAG: hypothetical protein BWX49_00280 [Bacteroidetes bacterium ADurb.Bin008]HNV80392.1 LuxR C-terminal-related transcriptional regulator [Tenuifilaceae bacterium]MZP82555.1 hypothetical protein [Bacteroidales bacterium]
MRYFTLQVVFVLLFFSAQSRELDSYKSNYQEFTPFITNTFNVHNQNWCIAQNPVTQLIYLANSEGLLEFNGIQWTKYPLTDRMPCRSVLVDSSGIIYTGSFEDFGYWQPNSSGILEYHSLSALTEIEKNDEIWKIYLHNRVIYFQSFTAIYQYNGTSITKITSPAPMLFLHQVGGHFITQIFEKGLYRLEHGDLKFIPNSDIFAGKKVHAIIPRNDGQWMVCTDNLGIYLYNGLAFNHFNSKASSFLSTYLCNSAKQVNDSTYAFGSILNGLIITNGKGEILSRFNTNNGLQNNTILSLHVGQDGGLWVGLDEGVNFINLSSAYTHYKTQNGAIGTIYALLKQGDKIYLGTNHGLFVTDVGKKDWLYNFSNIRLVEKSQGQVWSLNEFENQIICGHNDGTFVVDGENLRQLSTVTGGWSYTILGDYLLCGTYTGIVIFKKDNSNRWQFYSKPDNFLEPSRYIEVDYLGYIWASHHQKGIFRVEISEDRKQAQRTTYFPSINNEKLNLKVFKINNRVVFTTSENIYTYDNVRNDFTVIEPLSTDIGEYRSAIQICVHQKNEYWFVMEDRIALFEIGIDFSAKKLYEIRLKNITLPQHNINIIKLSDNTILVPTPEGLDSYNLSITGQGHTGRGLTIDKVNFYGRNNRSVTHLYPTKELTTSWNINNVTVHFSAPYLFDYPDKHYSYRIKELDSPWQSTTNSQFTFPGLKYGFYTIEIKDFTGAVASLRFAIAKPWYYSGLAITGYFLIFLLLIWLLYKYIKHKIRKAKEISAMEVRQSILEKELDYKNYELMLTIRHLIDRNEILTELQKEISTIKEHSSKYPIKNLRNMEATINEGLQSQTEDWKDALNKLKLSQQGFNKTLLQHFPNLTPHDLRLCSYLKMNFSTKEIARLLNISVRAVEISRYRLRKKLGLKHDENLTEFLINEMFTGE